MKRIVAGVVFVLLLLPIWLAVASAQQGAPPNIAFDIPKADIDLVLKNAPPSPPGPRPTSSRQDPASSRRAARSSTRRRAPRSTS